MRTTSIGVVQGKGFRTNHLEINLKLDMNEQIAVAAVEAVVNKAASDRPPLSMYTSHLYSPQEVYDFIVTRVIQQGKPALHDGHCVLLDLSGNRCAVGMLVPGTQGLLRTRVIMPEAEDQYEGGVPHLPLVVSLRNAHDDASVVGSRAFVGAFCSYAKETARTFGLSPAAVEIG